ncbi:MAG: hypothetical protein FD174_2287 [Geobacteraceae bacterium]|nr:MAG: hypothetical protein FD174_2287 [Geobacteraceae bacterium]
MSEYQYYEFLAIDRPLSEQEMEHMRALSSRGHITPVSFSNEYHWGNFKGDPESLMRRFYDAHVYLANWGTAVFMLRLPHAALDGKSFNAFTAKGVFEIESTPTHWLCSWSPDESEDYDLFGLEDGSGWMARLAPLREELLRGDLRSLYVGWLAAVSMGEVDEDELEPPIPDGLAPFTAAQQALAEFLEVDVDLLAGAGMDRPVALNMAGDEQIDPWLAALPAEEMRLWVCKLLTGQGQEAEREVKSRFSAWRKSTADAPLEVSRRTVAELWQFAEKAKEVRLQREKKRREQAEAKQLKEREESLARLAGNFPKAWQAINQRVTVGSGKAYDEACQALVDLAEAYSRHASRQAFDAELRRFMAGHGQRKSLVQRLVKVGLLRVI